MQFSITIERKIVSLIPQSLQILLLFDLKSTFFWKSVIVSKRQFLPKTFWNPLMKQKSWHKNVCHWYNFSACRCQAGTKNIFEGPMKTASAPKLTINITVFFSCNASVQYHCAHLQFMGQEPSSPLSMNFTPVRYHMAIQCPQTSILPRKTKFYPWFSCLRSTESRKQGSESAYFRSKELLTVVRVSKAAAMVESSAFCVKPGAVGGVLPFVMNCSCKKLWIVVSVVFVLSFAQAMFLLYLELLLFLGRTRKEMKTSSKSTV